MILEIWEIPNPGLDGIQDFIISKEGHMAKPPISMLLQTVLYVLDLVDMRVNQLHIELLRTEASKNDDGYDGWIV